MSITCVYIYICTSHPFPATFPGKVTGVDGLGDLLLGGCGSGGRNGGFNKPGSV